MGGSALNFCVKAEERNLIMFRREFKRSCSRAVVGENGRRNGLRATEVTQSALLGESQAERNGRRTSGGQLGFFGVAA